MITTPNGKNLMNLQEAVQWLLNNNALPFQCSANYVAGAEIGLGTIVNPSPAKVRVGSLIFFADSKVSTVIAITSNSFICSDEYNDLVDDVVYVSNVQLNASGHLIATLSNGDEIDAGLIKQVSGFSINASQHLIVSYNDDTTTDLGAIFSGNVNISGNFTADSIIENMGTGYGYTSTGSDATITVTDVYQGQVKNGNKLTIVSAIKVTRLDTISTYAQSRRFGNFSYPYAVAQKIYPAFTASGFGDIFSLKKVLAVSTTDVTDTVELIAFVGAWSLTSCALTIINLNSLDLNKEYYIRYEDTFLLSDPLS